MSTRSIGFNEEISKINPLISLNIHFICPSDRTAKLICVFVFAYAKFPVFSRRGSYYVTFSN